MPLALRDAQLLAARLAGDLDSACERIEIAGSVRRQKPDPKDIEIVLIPRWGTEPVTGQADLFGANEARVNLAQRAIEALGSDRVQVIKPGMHEIVPWHLNSDGKYWRLAIPADGGLVKVDVFVCTPETWGLNLMIRTGSGVGPSGTAADGFAPAMLVRWKQVSGGGMAYEAQLRGANGGTHPTPEEADVFDAVRVRFVPPEQRLSSAAVERNVL
jgi:DNA polymerase/3'-5' exonuclease PolX